jgi:Tol biopolymer transport system component
MLVTAFAAVALATGVNVGPVWSPNGARIAFLAAPVGGTFRLWTMRADGSARRQLTTHAVGDLDPSWSPDGTRLAFGSNGFVETIHVDGGGLRRLARGGGPVWSPDGTRLAYVTAAGIRTIAADGSGDRLLASTMTGFGAEPIWSPDRRRVAYLDGHALQVVAADGSGMVTLARPSAPGRTVATAAWSRDGSSLAYIEEPVTGNVGPTAIWLVPTGGGEPRRLASFAYVDGGPSWLPGGAGVIVTATYSTSRRADLYRVALTGKSPVNLTHDAIWEEGAAVSPAGKRVAFAVLHGTGYVASDIWTLDLPTSARRKLASV